MTALSGENLGLSRAGIPVLAEVNFTLNPGQALILRGPNGIGKTTLLRAIAGLQPLDAGTLHGAGDRTAYAAHADGVKSTLTVAENLRFWADCFGSENTAVSLQMMGLTALADRRAGHLSAGQKRRLGLARLMVAARPIWLLDEPTVSLDAATVTLFAAQIARHLDAGGMAMIATHVELGFAARVLDLTPYRAKIGQGAFDEAFL